MNGIAVLVLRREKGWTQSELAQRAGISLDLLSKLEKGKAQNPTIDTIRAIARALGVKTITLLTPGVDFDTAA